MRSPLAFAFVLLAACSRSSPAPSPSPAASVAAPPVEATATATSAVSGPAPCRSPDEAGVTLFVSPRRPVAGAPLRVIAVSERPIDAELELRGDGASAITSSKERHGDAPFWWLVEVPSATEGVQRARLSTGAATACLDVTVASAGSTVKEPRRHGGVWPVRAAWGRAVESLYSAWIEKLFDAPPGRDLVFAALHEALRDPARNLLFDHLGAGEDDGGPRALPIAPDCADLPYFLRAYFAFKLGLPIGYSSCTRGGGGGPPRCLRWHSSLEPRPARATEADGFVDFLRVTLADTVHSGTGRAPATMDTGDYYPVTLSFESLRPGTVYTDPYGHVLVVAKRVPEADGRAGVLYAVDGQPDGTVARRRFWRGNFLFAIDPSLGSAGWKRFRPVVVEGRGAARPLTNAEIAASPDYGDLSSGQYEHGVDGFYDAMDDALSPAPLDPERALLETLDALEEQVRGRVVSVGNAKRHFGAGGGRIEMPDGPSIFETTGPWEDLSTPSRDLRLLIAVDVTRGFPERVARRPERFAMPRGQSVADVRATLEARLARELAERRFSYERSDGSSFTLTLADIVARARELEVAYDPNDCPEVRWGATIGEEEASTCTRRAPGSDAGKMRRYRSWFRERRRPARE